MFINAASTRWYVSQSGYGVDVPYCGNISAPCRTIRFTVNKARSGDTIYINNMNGEPYEECGKSPNAIQLKKSLSFICPVGVAEIQCRTYSKNNIIFEIPRNNPGQKQTISFTSIKFTSTTGAVVNRHDDTRITIKRCLFENTAGAIKMYNQGNCHLQVDDSMFIDNSEGIHVECANVSVRLSNVTFRSSPVRLYNAVLFKVFIEGSFFYGNISRKLLTTQHLLFRVKSTKTSILNISVVSSTFAGLTDEIYKKYSIRYELPISVEVLTRNQGNITTTIYFEFNQVTVKNIHTNQKSTLFLSLPSKIGLGSSIVFLNSVFFNNTRALEIFKKTSVSTRTRHSEVVIRIKNTTFVGNYNLGFGHGAAVTLSRATYSIDGCKFLDNYCGNRYFTGVVVLMDNARATFQRCYFQNTDERNKRALQIFSPGNTDVSFKARNVFNLEKLKGNQPVIIHTSQYSAAPQILIGKIRLFGEIKIMCPEGYKFDSYTPVPLNTTNHFKYLEFNCNQCRYKTYSLQRGEFSNRDVFREIECHECPRAGVCTDTDLRSRPNFWGNNDATNGKVSFLNCPSGYCCQDDDECITYNSCHENRDGTLCGKCRQGTSELLFGTECQPNKECESRSFWIGISIIVPSYCLFFLYYYDLVKYLTVFFTSAKLCSKKSREFQAPSHTTETPTHRMFGGFLKIIFYYYQIIHVFSSSVGERGKAFKLIRHSLTPMFNLLLPNAFRIRCPFKGLQSVQKLLILHSLGFFLLLFIGLLFIGWKLIIPFKRKYLDSKPLYIDAVVQNDESDDATVDFQDQNHKIEQSFKCRIASAFIRISLLMYSSTAQLCLSLLHCVPIEHHKVLFIDGTLKCYQIFQYFAFVYVGLNIIPFCLVPVFGSYLLSSDSITLTEFCFGCLFPLPFCINWALLLFKRWRRRSYRSYVAVSSQLECLLGKDNLHEKYMATPKSAILQVLLGPFRSHSSFLCFPESPIPWEGFLIFRRLVIILLFTFVYDVNMRMSLVLVTCVLILVLHLVVQPFKRPRDNALETLSLSTLVILCGITHVKAIYISDETALNLFPLNLISIFETILIVTPLLVFLLVIIFALLFVFLVWFLKFMRVLRNKILK